MDISDAEYKKLQAFIYNKMGIDYDDKKKETVTTKVAKLAHRHKMASPQDYVKFILSATDADSIQEFFNEIATNTTSFFRESEHFDYIKNHMASIMADIPRIKRNGEIRIWNAPCSSGEESISTAIALKECLPPDVRIMILGTDISEKILIKAQRGIYSESECKGLSKQQLANYFTKQPDGFYKINEDIKKCITYRLMNMVMDDFKIKIKHNFDLVFCRNMMIYFDQDVQQKLINKFYDVLVPNGLFFIGHSESLLNKKHNYKYVQTALFKR